ncbi:hsp20-like protein [Thozetella sp. PMI_491]|nr:hsp20-like protein [Thozetella sp. PMI_491]
MAFFTRNLGSDASFHPLFRLLDDYESYSRQGQGNRSHKSHLPTFQPKFDVRELQDAYELHGELPGINKEDLSIEFSDAHTLHIRGRVERSYTSGTPPAGLLQDSNKNSGAITESGEEPKPASTNDHKARTAVAEKNSQEQSVSKPATPADNSKYWVSERSIGEFNRAFTFPGQIQQDAVSAGLKDGILTVRVPKAPKNDPRRRIQIN